LRGMLIPQFALKGRIRLRRKTHFSNQLNRIRPFGPSAQNILLSLYRKL